MQSYQGGCHCGEVRYEVDMDLTEVMSCNCSICSKKGHLLAFAPAEHFRLKKGDHAQSDYLFHKKRIHHLFCTKCGVQSFAKADFQGKDMRAINVRCLDGVDVSKFTVKHVDGKSF